MNELTVSIISKSANQWPLFIGVEEKIFANEELKVEIIVTNSSQKHLEALEKGMLFEIGHQAADHIVKSVVKESDLFMFMGISRPNQSLMVQPEIKTYQELRGKKLGVDGVSSGYALLLKELLKQNGLTEKEDYSLIPIGGTGERYNALINKEVEGAFIDGPVDLKAEANGLRRIGSNHDLKLDYQGTVAATTRKWASAHSEVLIKYIRGYIKAANFLYRKENKARAIEILKSYVAVSEDIASKTYDRYIALEIFNQGYLNISGLNQVVNLMKKTGELLEGQSIPEGLYDLNFYDQAINSKS